MQEIDMNATTPIIASLGEEDFILHVQHPTQLATGNETSQDVLCSQVLPASGSVNTNSLTFQQRECDWSDAPALLFLDLYERYLPLIGKKFKSKKHMFGQIASDMQAQPYNYKVSEEQVINRDKTLQRQIKQFLKETGPKGTGRARKSIPNEERVVRLYGKKHNITPKYLSTRNGEVTQEMILQKAGASLLPDHTDDQSGPSCSSDSSVSTSVVSPAVCKKNKREGKTATSLNAVKASLDIQNVQMQERTQVLERIAAANERWVEEQLKIKKETITQRERRNALLEKQVEVLERLARKKGNDDSDENKEN